MIRQQQHSRKPFNLDEYVVHKAKPALDTLVKTYLQ